MIPFHTKFPELLETETRVYTTVGDPDLPDGSYAFVEFFCDDPGCDCQRVMINVISKDHPGKVFATIGYGWKEKDFYRRFMGSGKYPVPENELKGPYLDPLNRQSKYAPKFLQIFEKLLEDRGYEERLERHYGMFKKAIHEDRKTGGKGGRSAKSKTKKKRKRKLAKAKRRKNR